MSGNTAVMAMEVTAPWVPGDYRLQLDIVQELASWFESHGADKLLEFRSKVRPATTPAAAHKGTAP